MNNRKLFNDKNELESSMLNYLKINQDQQSSEINKINDNDFNDEILQIDFKKLLFF